MRDENGRFSARTELTSVQSLMIVELISNGGNRSKACSSLGISRATLYKWLDNDLFIEEYRKAHEKMYQEHLSDAIKGIVDVATKGSGRDKVKACETILKLNGYLDTKVDISQSNKQEITVSLIDYEE